MEESSHNNKFCGSLKYIRGQMINKDYITIFISVSAFGLSLFSLIVTLVQKNKETKRTIRKNLSDTIENISKIGIETAKLQANKDTDFNSDAIIAIRRKYNSQRRSLITHADFLLQHYENLATETDYNVLADTYVAVGDIERAEYYWLKTIEKTKSNALRIMNLRGYGIFLFHNEKIELGRKIFDEAQQVELTVNDENRVMKIDTCLMLCDMETEFGSKENYEASLIKAMEILATMTSKRRKDEMHKRLRQKLPDSIKPTA